MRAPVAAGSAAAADARPYALNDGASVSGPAGGLTPAQLASAYGYEPATGGVGQTVAIVDAFDDPNIEKDLAKFDSNYGLPTCTTANGCFTKVGQTGSATSLPATDTTGWSVEISLDVETVHGACPNCKILLVEANNSSYKNLATAVNEAVKLGATEVSNSYGGSEAGMKAAEQAAYNHPGVVITAATGDDGYDNWDFVNEGYEAVEMPNAPASLPSVVAVGGTTLHLNANATRASEKVWNNDGPGDEFGLASGDAEGASGGGCSTLFAAQLWQQSAPMFAASGCATKRLEADIAAVADPYTGFDIYDTDKCGSYCQEYGIGKGWVTIGGTSLATPLISSLYGLAGGSDGVSYPALTLYGHLADPSALYDVTEGGNGFCDTEALSLCGDPNSVFGRVDCEGTTACNSAPGLDGPSGVGTPDGLSAFKPLLPTAAITPPSSLEAGVAASFSAAASTDPYPGGSIASYSWSWGDGTADGAGVSPTHTYAAPGTYLVTLTVTDNYGLTSAASTRSLDVSETNEEAAKKKHEEEEAAAKRKHEQEEAADRKHEEEAHEAEAAKRRQEEAIAQEEAAARTREDEATAAKTREEKTVTPAAVSQEVSGFQAALAPPSPDAHLASASLRAGASGTVLVRITCPAGVSRCEGTVTLRTLDAVSAIAGGSAKGRATILTLARGSFTIAAGGVTTVRLHLSTRARTLLAHSRTIRARATVTAHDPAGTIATTRTIVTLRAPERKHRKS